MSILPNHVNGNGNEDEDEIGEADGDIANRNLLVESNSEGIVEIITLGVPSGVQQQGDGQSGNDLSILQDPKWHDWVSGHFDFPKYESRDTNDHSDHEWSDDIGCCPLITVPTCEGERDEDECENGGDEEETDEIDLPEKVDP